MATVKGTGEINVADGRARVTFTIHLRCDDTDRKITPLLGQVAGIVGEFVSGRGYAFQDVVDNQFLISRAVLKRNFMSLYGGFFGTSYAATLVGDCASKIDLEFTKIAEEKQPPPPLRPEVLTPSSLAEPAVREVIKYVERPEPEAEPTKPKTAEDEVRERIEKKAMAVVAVSNTTKELLERYAPQMEADPDLREALTRLLESEKINAFDS
jgi:hypothetical protein